MARLKILVVDDEPEIRKFLHAALDSRDYTVGEAATAAEAIKLLSVHPPDLLILDLGLPDRDGLEVLKELRGWNALPVIVLSAGGLEQAKVEALEAGADDYLTKPFGAAELLARIKVALRHAQQGGQPPAAIYRQAELSVDLEGRVVKVGDKEVRLTPIEYKLLATLIRQSGRGRHPCPVAARSVGEAQCRTRALLARLYAAFAAEAGRQRFKPPLHRHGDRYRLPI